MRLTGTLMNLCLCLAWMQTVHIESSCLYLPIRVFMAVGCIWASHRCHSLDFKIVRDFQVDLVFSAVGALGGELSFGCELSLGGVLSLFLFLPFSVVGDRSAVAGTMIYIPLTSVPARVQEDCEVMEHFLFWNIVVCPPKSNWLIDRRESQKVRVWRAST